MRTGRAMFFSACSPPSRNSVSILPRTWRKASSEMQMPPGSAMPSRRAARLTPSPRISSPSIRMSPRWMPTRQSIRRSLGNPGISLGHQLLERNRTLHGAHHRGELDQHAVAGRLDDPPAMFGNERIGSGAMFAQQTRRTRLVGLHQPAVADHVGREDGGEAAVHPIRRSSLHGVLPGRASYTEERRCARPAKVLFHP